MVQASVRLENINISEMSEADVQALYLGVLDGTSKNPANDCDKIFRALERLNRAVEDVLKVTEKGLRSAAAVFSIGDGLVILGNVGRLEMNGVAAEQRPGASPGLLSRIAVALGMMQSPVPVLNPLLLEKFAEHARGLRLLFAGLHVADIFEPVPWPLEPDSRLSAQEQINQRELMAATYANHAVKQLLEAGIEEKLFEVETIFLRQSGEDLQVQKYRLAPQYQGNPGLLFSELKARCNEGGFFNLISRGDEGKEVKELVTRITEVERDIENKIGDPGLNQAKIEKLRNDLAQMYSATIGGYAILKKKKPEESVPDKGTGETNG